MSISQGDTVKVHYVGSLNDGTVFDSSEGRDPLQFTVGEQRVITGFESAVLGMATGESKTLTIPMTEAYGPHNGELIMELPSEQVPVDLNPAVGDELQLSRPDGQTFQVVVTEVNDASIKLDGNHPLAGKDLTFEIKIVEIDNAS